MNEEKGYRLTRPPPFFLIIALVWPPASCLCPSIIYAEYVLTFLDIDSFSSYKETSLPRMTINGHSGDKEERCIRVKCGSKQLRV
jgi:hypothetical protein